ncbi:MAG: hypothetical protein RL172_2745 [Bacteroidota bacterium]|jgi:acyl-CoA thioester hydrolase
MSRIKLEMPSTQLAQLSIPVRISDINYGNHVGNDAFVAILHEARLQWLAQHQLSELAFAGCGIIMSDLAIEFKKEAFYGDVISVQIFCGEISRVSFSLYYRLLTNRNNEQIILAHAKTGMITYDYAAKKAVSIPAAALDILQKNN